MSSAALSLVPSLSGAGASSGAPALSILSGGGADAASENSLFFSLLSLQNLGIQSTSSDAAAPVTDQDFGKSGFSFDPALLVLPSGLNQLSLDDLQNFLSQHSDLLANPDFLASLTPGTPQIPAADTQQTLPVSGTDLASLSDLLPSDSTSASPLAVTPDDAAQTSPLLVASNLTPQDIENLKAALEKAAAISEGLQHDLDDDTAAALALISLVPPPAAPVTAADAAVTTAIDTSIQGASYLQQSEVTRAQSLLDDLALAGGAPDPEIAAMSEALPKKQDSIFASSGNKSGTTNPLKSFEVSQLSNLLALQAGSSGDANGYQALLSEAEATDAVLSGTLDDAATSGLDATTGLFLSEAQKQMGNFDPSLTAANYTVPSVPVQSAIANPVLYNSAAGSTHPATQTLASEIKATVSKSGDEQTLSVQLDPPELGRVQIQLSYEKGEPLRLHVVAEKKETLAILERDAGVLKTTLEQAGIQADTSSMSFDLASGDQQFDQFLQNSGGNNQQSGSSSFNLDGGVVGFDASGTLTTEVGWGGIDASGNVRYTLLV